MYPVVRLNVVNSTVDCMRLMRILKQERERESGGYQRGIRLRNPRQAERMMTTIEADLTTCSSLHSLSTAADRYIQLPTVRSIICTTICQSATCTSHHPLITAGLAPGP